MATTYHFYKQGYAIPYDAFGHVVLKKRLDVPALIASGAAGYSPLAVDGVRTALADTGFGIADILELFRVPAGFQVLGGGVNVVTVGTDTIDMGVTSATQTQQGAGANRFLDDAPITATNVLMFDAADGDAWTTLVQDVYITNGTIDVLFNTSAEAALIADFWILGCKVF